MFVFYFLSAYVNWHKYHLLNFYRDLPHLLLYMGN